MKSVPNKIRVFMASLFINKISTFNKGKACQIKVKRAWVAFLCILGNKSVLQKSHWSSRLNSASASAWRPWSDMAMLYHARSRKAAASQGEQKSQVIKINFHQHRRIKSSFYIYHHIYRITTILFPPYKNSSQPFFCIVCKCTVKLQPNLESRFFANLVIPR